MPDQPQSDQRTAAILGAAFEVHNTLGPGFEETFYQRALAREFAARDLDFSREIDVPVFYKGEKLGTKRIDFVVEGVMLEIKARRAFEPQDYVRALSYQPRPSPRFQSAIVPSGSSPFGRCFSGKGSRNSPATSSSTVSLPADPFRLVLDR